LHYYLQERGIILALQQQNNPYYENKAYGIIASCGTAKQGCPATNYQAQKSKASKKSRAPKKYETSTFN
jgi:hypothetical protein